LWRLRHNTAIFCRSRTCECIPIPVLKTSLILLASCPMRGRFLEAILQRTERKLAEPGRPGTVDRLVAKVERREVPRPTSLGARGALPREVGTLILPPRVPAWCPGASRRSTPLAHLARDWQTSDALRRENAEAWLFEIRIERCAGVDKNSTSSSRKRGPIPSVFVRWKVSATCGSNSPNNNHGGYGSPPSRGRHRWWGTSWNNSSALLQLP